jgi:hypothetical protein
MLDNLIYNKFVHHWLERSFLLRWLRLLVVIGVLLMSALLAYLGSQRQITLLIGLFIGIGIIIIFLSHPSIGIAGVIIAGLIIPFTIGTGTGTSINAAVLCVGLLTGLWIFDMLVYKHRIQFKPSRVNLPLFIFMIVCIISFITGQINWIVFARLAPVRAQIGGFAVFILSVSAFLLVANHIENLTWLRRLTWIFLGLGAIYIIGRIIPGIRVFIDQLFQYGSTVSLFWVWLVALASSQAFFNRQLGLRFRLLLMLLVIATIYVSLAQSYTWKSGWLPALIGLLATVWIGAPRLRLPVIVAGLMIVWLNFREAESYLTGSEGYSISTRVEAWRIIWEIVKVNPVLGLGFANYYFYTPLFPILGYYVQFNSHNNYVDIIAQTGFAGLICFLWFIGELGVSGWRLKEEVSEGFAKAYIIGALGGLVGTLVAGMLGDWFLPFVYNVGLNGFRSSVLGWLFLGGIVAIEQMVHRSMGQPES